MRWLLIFYFCLATCSSYQGDDWIDPTDMLNYDASAGRMKNQKQHPTGNHAANQPTEHDGACHADDYDCRQSTDNWKKKGHSEEASKNEDIESRSESTLHKCKEDLESLKQEMDKSKTDKAVYQNNCNPVFRRYLHRILNEIDHLGLPGESQPEIHYDAEIVLTKEMVAEMQRFLSEAEWNAGALDEVLTRTLIRFKYHNIEEWTWKLEDYIGLDPFTAFMISLSVLCIITIIATELWTHVSWFTQLRRLFVILFVISIGWNWMYLYKVAFAERQAELAKTDNSYATCGKKVSWTESLVEWWRGSAVFQNDPCEEYYKALMINPILLVPPTKALAVTFTNFITEPLKHVGKGIGEFFHALLAEMPVLYQLPVLVIIALLFLVFCYGFGTSLPHMNLLRGNRDAYRERLPPPEGQAPAYNRYIEGGHHHYNHSIQQNQGRYIEGQREPLNIRPAYLHDMDHSDGRNQQQEQLHQMKNMISENRTYGQDEMKAVPVSEKPYGPEQNKRDTVENRSLPQKLMKNPAEEQYSEEDSLNKRELFEKSPIPKRNSPGSPTPLLVSSVGAVENTQHHLMKHASSENRTYEQNEWKEVPVNKTSSAQEQNREDTVEHRTIPQKLCSDSQHVQLEESLKDKELLDKPPVPERNFLGSPTPLLVTSVGAVENMNQSSAEAKEETESCPADLSDHIGKQKDINPQEAPKDDSGFSDPSVQTSALPGNAQEAENDSHTQSPETNVNSEDIYTDPDSLSFVILENQD